MADKRIQDFATVTTLNDDDLFLVGNQYDTYNAAYSTIKREIQSGMLGANMGSENAGKTLIIGTDGRVKLSDSGGGGGGTGNLIKRTIEMNGTYYAEDDGASGYYMVIVNRADDRCAHTEQTTRYDMASFYGYYSPQASFVERTSHSPHTEETISFALATYFESYMFDAFVESE